MLALCVCVRVCVCVCVSVSVCVCVCEKAAVLPFENSTTYDHLKEPACSSLILICRMLNLTMLRRVVFGF